MVIGDARLTFAQLPKDRRYDVILLAAFSGETTQGAPADYVRRLFDQYAPTFEEHLVRRLAYAVPEGLRALIDAQGPRRFRNAVDLGCGTEIGRAHV